ncbi:MAG TPA: hypothetical protein VNI84_01160 [Pyrinomonadaceae bacterium]|nr:hypothetical protein [Pyrinomonadaceae bacterium]
MVIEAGSNIFTPFIFIMSITGALLAFESNVSSISWSANQRTG